MKRKFECEVVTTNKYIIEIDDEIINEKWLQDYRQSFTGIKDLKGHAENVAWYRSLNGEGFYEGYGYVLQNGKEPWASQDGGHIEKGINIEVISEDDDTDIDVTEIQ